jgi:hypothetical protein
MKCCVGVVQVAQKGKKKGTEGGVVSEVMEGAIVFCRSSSGDVSFWQYLLVTALEKVEFLLKCVVDGY